MISQVKNFVEGLTKSPYLGFSQIMAVHEKHENLILINNFGFMVMFTTTQFSNCSP